MEFEAKISFKLEDLPDAIYEEYLLKLVQQDGSKGVVVIDGVKIYKDSDISDLEMINLSRMNRTIADVNMYAIVNRPRNDAVPSWLSAMPSSVFSFGPLEFLENLGISAKIGPSPHGGGTEISGCADEWCKVLLLFTALVQVSRGRKCEHCGATITTPLGKIITDPRVKLCLGECIKR